ncbi:hypothetical protein FSP39_015814 [Pinctada imbricata]|uniref:Reverse transcriptase domain-containing protein n=1 Tax=Pinctada imbricata TaxID=66713 RepID=A0AA89C1Y6_PINIB|nr:hypothetical protein FSP39_015814 [Pinctada imbricata]
MWTSFRDNILRLLEKHVPHKLTRSRYTNPWMDTSTRRLARQKNRAFKKAKATGSAKDHRSYQRLKTSCQKSIRQAHNNYMRDIISPDATQNPKKFWSFVKGKKQESSGVAPLRHEDGTLHSNSQTKANILNTQFKSVFTKEALSALPDKGVNPYSSMEPIDITVNGVRKLLQNVKPHKATGPDSIPARLLKELSDQLAPALTRIYRESLTTGELPDDWKMAHIVPIFKKGDKSKASNYRPVSLTSICSKLMEHILHSNIITHLEQHSILTDTQHGFRSRRSCETQLIYTVHELARNLSEGKQIDAILLDFSKAFDKVPHERLLYKLHYYGVRDNTLTWVRSFLQGRKQLVLVEGERSEEVEVDSGVPHWTVLGPLLFLAFNNDLPEVVDSPVRLFADDVLPHLPNHHKQRRQRHPAKRPCSLTTVGGILANDVPP